MTALALMDWPTHITSSPLPLAISAWAGAESVTPH